MNCWYLECGVTKSNAKNVVKDFSMIELSTVRWMECTFSEDYPTGSWLGDETNVEMRVRCGITPRYVINTCCVCHQQAESDIRCLFNSLMDHVQSTQGFH